MTDLTKNKIAYAVGLLAVLFTLTPLLDDFGSVAFSFLSLSLSLKSLYWFLSATLGLGVYFYGFQFLMPQRRVPTVLGDIFYITGLVGPLLYASLFLIASLLSILEPLLRNEQVLKYLQFLLGVAAGVTSAVSIFKARRVLDMKQRQAEKQQRASQEASYLVTADSLAKSGNYDLSVIEAFRALEVAGRGRFGTAVDSRRRSDWFRLLLKALPEDTRQSLERTRTLRNSAAHAVQPVSEAEAKEALGIISKAIALLADTNSDVCPECGSKSLKEESGVDSGFHWTRKDCQKCGYIDFS